jgi:segregation and condensation protein A
MLPREQLEELIGDLDGAEAVEELLARLLETHRYRGGARELGERLAAESGYRFRCAPPPRELRRARLEGAVAIYEPERLARALGDMLREPAPIELGHLVARRVSLADRCNHLRALLRKGSIGFDEAVAGADRVTVAITLFALLELYKRGEAHWRQEEPFGPIEVIAAAGAARARSAAQGAAA